MPVPFEALIPYAIIVTMFGVTGAGLSAIKTAQNGGKKARWSLDTWDRYEPLITANYTSHDTPLCTSTLTATDNGCFIVMDRDRRLTGWLRGQTDAADAPYGFEYNNPWRGGKAERIIERTRLTHDIATTAPTTLTVTFHDIDTAPLFGPYQPCAEKQDA
ncbi:unnamed protein product [Sordaria macrospora k-hell]|uniref:NADH dehydrogenase [ubiquinone] 1 alpha subcomplex subunit 1 n=1 Tax=Sordaria macrospora (strain ATCC MYA-333 / DSM 997 / K(L3346) / K-hell) TaxID=771870 RepID=F7VW39_SORMK|nr:uncharacterized protein SMAC_03417 [Sordaria macrospora k-hell]KAH7629928.1 hypothetical protein B0T09DRAFT_383513 [Sordaria sp. MPI-SDFR-AT-0083]CCC09861.1 unnamed protein product [Sordaria macrospora k-hell]